MSKRASWLKGRILRWATRRAQPREKLCVTLVSYKDVNGSVVMDCILYEAIDMPKVGGLAKTL